MGVLEELLVQSVSHIGELLGITIFDSEASFKKNVLSSEHENWHQQVRDFLEKEPEWNDGVILLSTLASPGPTRI